MVFIKGYENKYSITKYGEVYSHVRDIYLKQDLRGNYYAVKLGKYGKKVSVHRLVAEAFIPNPKSKTEVNHIDGNKHNNNLGNLEWVTRKENIIHAQMNGLQKVRTYPVFKRQKINDNEIKEVCTRFKNGVSAIALANKYNVTRGAIYAILKNNNIEKRNYVIQ